MSELKFINGKFVDPEGFDTFNVPKIVVDVAEYLAKLAPFASPNGTVEGENDWKIINKLFEAFVRCYPQDYQEFILGMDKIHKGNALTKGYNDDKEYQHQMEIPEKFNALIKVFYPLQSYDTEFSRRLVRELPVLKATR